MASAVCTAGVGALLRQTDVLHVIPACAAVSAPAV
jgi:hypothetical protein